MRHVVLGILLVLAACGDNVDPAGDAGPARCAPTPPAAPTEGPYADPRAIPLPAACVEGGLEALPGRWFVRDPARLFTFSYPKFEGSCDAGFRRVNWQAEDTDVTDDNHAFQSWADGTRYYARDYYRFSFGEQDYEIVNVLALCALPDGTLAGVQLAFDTDRGERIAPLIGTRFAPKDTGGQGLTLVGELGVTSDGAPVSGYQVAVDGTHAFVAGPSGLDVFDVSAPAAPVHQARVPGEFNDIKLARSGDDLIGYAAPIGNAGVTIVDVSTPSAATAIAQLDDYAHSVFVTATPPRLYLADYTDGVPVFDVTAPRSPVRIGTVPTGGDPDVGIHDIHVDGTTIYANKTTDGVVAVDVSAGFGASAVRLGGLPTSYSHASWAGTAGGRAILIHGDEGLAPEGGAFLRVLDAERTSPTFMLEIGRYATRPDVGIHNMILIGDRAYISYYQDGIRIVDLADPTQPREIAHFNTWDEATAPGAGFEGAVGLTVVGDLIYVADLTRGLLVLRDDTN